MTKLIILDQPVTGWIKGKPMYSRRGWYEVRRDGVRARCMAYWNGRRFNKFRVFHTHDKPLSKMALFNAFAIAGNVTAFRGLASQFPAVVADRVPE